MSFHIWNALAFGTLVDCCCLADLESFGLVHTVTKQLLSISVFPLPWGPIYLPEIYLCGSSTVPQKTGSSLPQYIRNHLFALTVYLGQLTWLTIIWPDLCADIKKKPACVILDDRVIRSAGCYTVLFSSIHCKTECALVLLPDVLWMVVRHVVVNVTMPENFSRFNQLLNDSFLQIVIHKENQTKKADKSIPLVPSFPSHFSNQWSSFGSNVIAGCLPSRKHFV